MQSATERRQSILEYVSDKRQLTYADICNEFNISYSTARRDILILSCSYPIITVSGNGGGVRAIDGWYISRRYLKDEQEMLLRKLMEGLECDEQKTMQSILTAFAKPKSKEA